MEIKIELRGWIVQWVGFFPCTQLAWAWSLAPHIVHQATPEMIREHRDRSKLWTLLGVGFPKRKTVDSVSKNRIIPFFYSVFIVNHSVAPKLYQLFLGNIFIFVFVSYPAVLKAYSFLAVFRDHSLWCPGTISGAWIKPRTDIYKAKCLNSYIISPARNIFFRNRLFESLLKKKKKKEKSRGWEIVQ